jgi:Flp pilus assembly protein TadG
MTIKASDGRSADRRRGAALVELAIILPVLAVLAVITVDAARLFFHHLTIVNCARNGALYESDTASPLRATYTDYKQAALADAQSLSPALTTADITSASGSDSGGTTVSVTVTYKFPLLTSYLGFTTISLSSTVTMRVASVVPN